MSLDEIVSELQTMQERVLVIGDLLARYFPQHQTARNRILQAGLELTSAVDLLMGGSECENCEGLGFLESHEGSNFQTECPKCGGTGK